MSRVIWLVFRLIGVFMIGSQSGIKLTAGAWNLTRATTPPNVTSAPAFCPDAANQRPNPAVFRPNPSRVFPFCVGKDPATNQWDPLLVSSGFADIIDDVDRWRTVGQSQAQPNYIGFVYDPTTDHVIHTLPTSPVAIPDISMEVFKVMHVYAHDYFGKPKKKELANWIIIQFRGLFFDTAMVRRGLQGIYIQAYHGPLGIPFGQFVRLRHTYGEDKDPFPPSWHPKQDDAPAHFLENSRTYPCTFYSKAGPDIPSVFLWSTKLYSGAKPLEGKFNVTFRWDDPVCAEVAFFQLLVLVVYDWGNMDYNVGLSQILLPGELLFATHSVSVPEYPDWGPNELESYRDEDVKNVIYNRKYSYTRAFRMVSNVDYEHCVQHHVGLVKRGPQKGACPPGPFKCDKFWSSNNPRPADDNRRQDYYRDLWGKWKKNYDAYNHMIARQACPSPLPHTPIAPPPPPTPPPQPPPRTTPDPRYTTTEATIPPPRPTTTRKPTAVENQTKAVEVIAKKVEKAKVIKHGDLCVIVWFVLIPFSNFVARFLKDFGNFPRIGLGFWIIAHVALHHLGVLLMWISFGLVVSNGVSFFGGAGKLHYLFGFPATMIQHFELFNAFNRHRKLQTAERQSIVHMLVGHVASALSLLCGLYSNVEKAKGYIIGALFFVSIVATVVATVVEHKISRILGMYPPRKLFPVMERVVMVNTGPRLWKIKLIITFVYLLLLIELFLGYYSYDYVIGEKTW